MFNRPWVIGAVIAALVVVGAVGFSSMNKGVTAQDGDGLVVLNRGNSAEPSTLDPHKMTGTWESRIVGDLFVGLYTAAADGSVILGAAESHEVSEDGLTHTFTIREGHTWSDGVPVTAFDFEFAWRRFVSPETAAEFASLLEAVVNTNEIILGEMDPSDLGAFAQDERTFVVQLAHPEPFIPEIVGSYFTYPVPSHVVEEFGDQWVRPGNMVSNGPYMLTEWVSNDHIKAVKNPYFYDTENVAIDEIIFYPTDDSSSALRRFRAGELDLNTDFPSQQYQWLQENMPEEMRVPPAYTTSYIVVNTTQPPFDDARVRRALGLAINRDTITHLILKTGQTPAYTLVPPYVEDYPTPTPDYVSWTQEQRLAEAQRLMTEAGYSADNLLRFTYRYRESIDNRRAAIAVAQMWGEAFIEVNLVNTEVAVHYADLRAGNFTVADAGWQVSYADPGQFLLLTNMDFGELNTSMYDSREFADLFAQAQMTPDRLERGAILARAEAMMLNDAPLIPTYYGISKAIVGPHIQGWVDNPENVHRTRWLTIDESLRPEQTSFSDRIMRLFN